MTRLRTIADPDALRTGTVIAAPGREGEPFFLYGFTATANAGAVGITNAECPGIVVPLWRFRSRAQAEAAGAVIRLHSSLDLDGETRFVPEAREARSSALQRKAFIAWARRISPEIEGAIARKSLGAGAYSLADRAAANSRCAA